MQADESMFLSATSTETVQASACEQFAASTRRGSGAPTRWHEACTTLHVDRLTESARSARRILRQDRTGRQLLTVDALPPREFGDRPRLTRMEWEPLSRVLCRREAPYAALNPAQLAAPSLRIAVGVGRKGSSRR